MLIAIPSLTDSGSAPKRIDAASASGSLALVWRGAGRKPPEYPILKPLWELQFAEECLKPNPYDENYYRSEGLAASQQSARVVVPIVMSLLRPASVIDVGCGPGAWLQAFQENGVERILGLDGEYVERSWLLIPRESFRAVDLSKPLAVDGAFDLAICLEVAEHLPRKCAGDLVRRLTALAPQVLFSAAVPFQGGTHHINEQWPEFWGELFAANGYRAVDAIRKQIWKDREVAYWYRQNLFLYVREERIAANPKLAELARDADDLMLVNRSILYRQMGVRSMLKQLPRSVWQAGLRRVRKTLGSQAQS